MSNRTHPASASLSIAAVERDTGLSKDTLRVWERRYGFPKPLRDAVGERAYSLAEVDKLRLLKRLLDGGHRPGRIVPLPVAELQALAACLGEPGAGAAVEATDDVDLSPHLELIRQHDAAGLRSALMRQQLRLGLGRFVIDVVAPLNLAIGDAWLRGQMEIFQEHLYTESVQVVLRQGIAALPPAPERARPRVLLTTFPGEPHGLGLLMAEAMFALDGATCLSLGVQTPLWDIVLGANAYRADIVALGFTGCTNPNQIVDGLLELRSKLPPGVAIWAGGSAPVLHRRRVEGVQPIDKLEGIVGALAAWRQAAPALPVGAGE